MVIQFKEHADRTIAVKVLLAPSPAGVSPTTPESSLAVEIQNKILDVTFWLLHGILDYFRNNDGQPEILLIGGSYYDAT